MIILLILLVSLIFRFYHLSALFHWTLDEELWSYLPLNIATGYHFPLIGGHIGGTGLYSGPAFVYLMSIVAKLFSGDPLGFGIFVSSVGVACSILIYNLGSQIFGKRVAAVTSVLYSSSFLMAMFDRHYWNASLTPVLSLLTIFCLWKIHLGKLKYAIVLAFILILAFHAHGTGMALLIFTFLTWIVFRLPVRNRLVVAGVIIFLLGQLPLAIFDARHDFLITRAFFRYFQSENRQQVPLDQRTVNISSGFVSSASRLVYFQPNDLALEQSLCKDYRGSKAQSPFPITLLVISALAYGLIKARKNKQVLLLYLLIISCLGGLAIYNEYLPEYFFTPSFVPIFFILAISLKEAFGKTRGKNFWLSVSLALYFALNLQTQLTAERGFNYDAKIEAARKIVSEIGSDPFELTVESSDRCQVYGMRYLFTFLGRDPVKSDEDSFFFWLYKDRFAKTDAVKHVVVKIEANEVTYTINPR